MVNSRGRMVAAGTVGLLAITLPAVPATAGAGGPAPGAPGIDEQYRPADKSGFGTARSTASKVWFTVQKEGGLGEIYYPRIDSPAARALEFVVADRRGHAVRVSDAAVVRTSVTDPRSLSFRQTFAERHGKWRFSAAYATDPARPAVLVDLRFDARGYDLYAIFDPALGNTRGGDSGRTEDGALVATDGDNRSVFAGGNGFAATSSGFRGVSDGWTDLLGDGRMDWHYASAGAGNLVQTAKLKAGRTTLAVAFGGGARASLGRGFDRVARDYADGWHHYVDGLRAAPASLRGADQRQLYRTSAMVLAASEDKTHRGAYVAAPAMPWAFGRDDPSGPYHLVWSRDLYQIATGLIAAGDTAGANRALDHLFGVQQKPDGSFPQNARTDGTPVWEGLQLDEVALPIVLAHQLRRYDTWPHVKRAADFLLGYQRAPWSPQERWENQSGYSPATIAAEIAGLVCAADLARRNGDPASARRYEATADEWQSHVKAWTVTSTGPYSSKPYFLRLTKDGQPDRGTTYTIGDSGPSDVDQRRVVDPSFLELVRLGVLPAGDPDIRNTLRVIDEQLGVRTPHGPFWRRASFDGFGEKRDGSPWDYGLPDDSRLTLGRAWPLLTGERGEYDLDPARIGTMASAAGPGFMLPEQVWDGRPPNREPGTPTYSATPLTWAHAQFIRLARNVEAGRVTERPAVVARRYLN
ncbi:glycoside hydrolase family 15 protein [Actinoplanes sp. NPDC049265]|uniref:glycoside hydrolase family 15 protein n=1 Tax=Actinoplanes sp. NPDC049265 TaxID=3363902 RepID=UPI00371C175B